MPTTSTSLLVAVGGAIGSLLRYWLAEILGATLGTAFPWGVLIVNITGCFIIGLFGAVAAQLQTQDTTQFIRYFVMAGICGGYTTFSAFSLQTFQFIQKSEWLYAGAYITSSVILCLVATWTGTICAALISVEGR